MTALLLGTRKSALAQAQAHWVSDQLRAALPDLKIEFVMITTSGDLQAQSSEPMSSADRKTQTLAPGGLKAMFTKEIEEALLEKRIDVAVHSLKDMAAELPAGLQLSAVPEREDPRDVWISQNGVSFAQLKRGGKIATGAVRREAQLRHHRPDLDIVTMRGNVDTRLRKLAQGDLDGLILALAGLKRLGREKAATETISEEIMLPAVGQGALGIQTRQGDAAVQRLIQTLDHPASHQAILAERAFLKALGGSCQTPIAAHAKVEKGRIAMTGLVVAPQGDPYLRANAASPIDEAEKMGQSLARKLLKMGADKILS